MTFVPVFLSLSFLRHPGQHLVHTLMILVFEWSCDGQRLVRPVLNGLVPIVAHVLCTDVRLRSIVRMG